VKNLFFKFCFFKFNLYRYDAAHAERALSVWRAAAEELGASPDEWRKDTVTAGAGAGGGAQGPGGTSP
jgi:hypothetical protein